MKSFWIRNDLDNGLKEEMIFKNQLNNFKCTLNFKNNNYEMKKFWDVSESHCEG